MKVEILCHDMFNPNETKAHEFVIHVIAAEIQRNCFEGFAIVVIEME
jgi:hypothetical protein